MLHRLDKYLLSQFFTVLSMSLLGFLIIFLIVDLIENLDRFVDNGVPVMVTITYYIYTIPWFISVALPMSMLMSTVFSVGMMVKRNEWTAMKSTGISLYRLSAPLLFVGMMIEKYNVKKMSGDVLTWVDLGSDLIRQRIDAKKIYFDDESQFWKLSNYSIRKFEGGIETNVQFSEEDTLIDLSFTPEDINKQARSPDELDYYELTSRIFDLKENGVKTVKWEVTRHLKVSFSLTNFIVVLCGIPLVVFREKNSLSFGIGMSVFVIFGYYAFIKFFMNSLHYSLRLHNKFKS